MKKPLLVVRLAGGLGNQMFMYAAARRLASVNDAELALDVKGGFASDPIYQRKYQLDWFNIDARLATPRERLEPFNNLRRSILKRLYKKSAFTGSPFIKQRGVEFNTELLETRLTRNAYFEGLWQGEAYFSDIEDIIRQDFQFIKPMDEANNAMAAKIKSHTSIAIHLRFFAPSSAEKSDNSSIAYYQKALAEIERRVEDPHYFLFSDRPEDALAALNLPDHKLTLVNHNTTDETAPCDMWLMSQCHHFIIANSSFSWWGAWLGQSDDKIVIAPALGPSPFRKYNSWGFKELLPESWLQIKS